MVSVNQRTFDILFNISFKHNRNVFSNQFDASRIYYHSQLPFDDKRFLNTSIIKIPTFRDKEGNMNHYAICLNYINWYRTGEIKQIWKQNKEIIDNRDIDSYTIFLHGKLNGFIDPVLNTPMKYWKTYLVHDKEPKKQTRRVLQRVHSFLNNRVEKMNSGGVIIGNLASDLKNLKKTVEALQVYLFEVPKVSSIIKEYNNKNTNYYTTKYNKRKGGRL